jgi:transcription antitermination factor NusG
MFPCGIVSHKITSLYQSQRYVLQNVVFSGKCLTYHDCYKSNTDTRGRCYKMLQPVTRNVTRRVTSPVTSAEQERRNRDRIDRVNDMLARCDRWYVLVVPPQHELPIERILQRQLGMDAFCPIQFRWRRVNSRQKVRKYVPYVMASRYIFVGTRGEPQWHRIFGTRLFSGVLSIEGEPVVIPPATMRGLFARSGEEAARESAVRLNRSIVGGDTVRIIEGPFQGHEVKVADMNRHTARVVVELFKSAREIEVDVGALEPV